MAARHGHELGDEGGGAWIPWRTGKENPGVPAAGVTPKGGNIDRIFQFRFPAFLRSSI